MQYRVFSICTLIVATQACNHDTSPAPQSERAEPSAVRTAVTVSPEIVSPSASGAVVTATGSGGAWGSSGAGGTAGALSDEQIAAITDDANSAEIEQAQLAESKAKDPRIKEFAAMMIKHHTEAKQKQAKLAIKTASSPASTELEKDGQDTLSKLKSAAGKDFDDAYIDAQVEEHRALLMTIERDLLPNAKSADLKAYLAAIKPTVDSHLHKAKQLQGSLEQSASAK